MCDLLVSIGSDNLKLYFIELYNIINILNIFQSIFTSYAARALNTLCYPNYLPSPF